MFRITDDNRRWWVTVTMSVPMIVLTIDFFGIAVAMPSIGRQFDSSTSSLAWVINAYMLGLAGFLVVSGRLGDLVGRRKVMLLGVLLFSASSIVCGLAPSEGVLIGARAVQGIGGAFIYSNSLAIVSNAFPTYQRGVGVSLWVGIGTVGSAIGPFFGGLLTELLSWRWFFFVNLPFGVAAIVMAILIVRESRDEDASPSIDWIGCALATGGVVLLVLGLLLTGPLGWGSPVVWAALGAAVVALAAFTLVEARIAYPLIELDLFKNRDFGGSAAIGFLINFTLGAMMLFMTLYLQHVGGLSSLMAGLVFLAFSLPLAGMSLATGSIAAQWGQRHVIAIGMAVLCLSYVLLVFSGTTVSYALVVFALILGGVGQALAYSTSTTVVMNSLPDQKAGAASGAFGMIRVFATAVGLAVATAIFKVLENNELAGALQQSGASLTPADIRDVHGLVSGSDAAATALAKLAPAAAETITDIVNQAFITGFAGIMVVCAALSLLGVAAAYVISRPQDQKDG